MSGAGQMLHAFKSIKFNRDQFKNKRSEKKNSFTISNTRKTKFKKVSPEELEIITLEIKEDAKKEFKREIIFYGSITCFTIAIAVLVFLL
ncbi:hypothetical protein KO500_11855 [Cellulophaga baltica]|uniref:hypothetical protein n=1 Tax=Cellulophaga TaxID=104264 RepID=UPI001C0795DE|nr:MULTISPECIES: hypothetical protein [Cellulophaga]MBU2997134.1 hypothetical protein [Cellulophaga baltica]MDO6768532.1 hypothetical protein [Cellulophaga sp. 1_MG-2023]